MVVKVNGEFVGHKHDDTDDFIVVLSGRPKIRLRDRDVVLTRAICSSSRLASRISRAQMRRHTCF